MANCIALPQEHIPLVDPIPTPSEQEIDSDTTLVSDQNDATDSTQLLVKFKFDSNYKPARVHPYFRNEYRLIQDMRRLFSFVNRSGITGYESMSELMEIGRNLPKYQQTKLIGAAIAGGIVNFISSETNRLLRKRKMRFVQWKLEKVVFQGSYRYFYADFYNGMEMRGVRLQVPALRLSYLRQLSQFNIVDQITCWPISKLCLNYTQYNKRIIISTIFLSPLGNLALSYDKNLKIFTSGFELRRSMAVIIRLLYVNYMESQTSHYIRSEVLLRW